MNKPLKPLEFTFDTYKVVLQRNHFKLYQQRQLTVWEGALPLLDAGLEPTTYEQVAKSPELCKLAIKAIMGKLTVHQKRKRAVALNELLICAIPDLSWANKIRAMNQL